MAPAHQHKTLPHALGRAATTAATTLQAVSATDGGKEDKFGKALGSYAGAWEKIADARVQQDQAIQVGYLLPWQVTLSNSIAVSMRARQAVRVSRLELDAAKQTYVHLLINPSRLLWVLPLFICIIFVALYPVLSLLSLQC